MYAAAIVITPHWLYLDQRHSSSSGELENNTSDAFLLLSILPLQQIYLYTDEEENKYLLHLKDQQNLPKKKYLTKQKKH